MAKSKKSRQSSGGKKSGASKNSGKKSSSRQTAKVKTEYEGTIPANLIVATVSILLFILFLVIGVNPEGLLLAMIQSVILGLIGQAGFYFAIPAFLYIFIINVFGKKTNVAMRSICTGVFVFICGVIFHLTVQRQGIASGFDIFADLYQGGKTGLTGGVLCGGVAVLLRWACGNVISYLILITAAVLTLLGAMQITIPSILRAIANRPRANWDEEDEQEEVYIEPAAVVVNHIANKQIEHKRQRREQQKAALRQLEEPEQVRLPEGKKIKKPHSEATRALPEKAKAPAEKKTIQPAQQEEPVKPVSNTPANASKMMSILSQEIGTPLSGSPSRPVRERKPARAPEKVKPTAPVAVEVDDATDLDRFIPSKMPALDLDYTPPAPAKVKVIEEESVKPAVIPAAEEKPGKVTAKDAEESAQQVAQEIAQGEAAKKAEYCFPPIDLLKLPKNGSSDGVDEMRENSRLLNETLASFHIDAHITNVTRGPSVTRYEVELDKGVRLNKLTNCADDIALSLGASGVRIAAVPGKISIVGIEVPNQSVTTVSLREVIESNEFRKSKSKSSFAAGKDIGGSCIVGNISKMPHLLIAGTTGSGKSVCMNSIIISLLYKSGPDDVKLIMVDPKMVELGIYNGIPHLLIPVVTDPKKAAGSLQWAVVEMLRRYKMMSEVGVRDLESYNAIVTAEEGGKKLPQIIVIIDELADLMLVAAKEVEDSICRIAQMGRAAGMHLIIATQRPSADVITGLMKANIPSRIAFSVASAMESRIILDTQGAEKLVGKGDMLYAPIGSGKPLRVQGCFVTDGEVEAVAGYVKNNFNPDYNQEVLEEIEKKAQQTGKSKNEPSREPDPSAEETEGDEMLPAAVEVILETGQASVSMLQRRLKLGYARAARIVDEMEEKGIVGPFQGSKPRAILVTKEQWAAMHGGAQQMEMEEFEDTAVPEEID